MFLFALSSCAEKENVQKLTALSKVSEISDTLFLSQVTNLTANDDFLFLVDNYRGQTVRLNKDLTLNALIGSKGEGPDDLVYLSEIVLHNDTLYAFDTATGKVMLYDTSGKLCRKNQIDKSTGYTGEGSRFLITQEGKICISTTSPKGAFVEQDFSNNLFHFWGERFSFKNEQQAAIRNDRFLFEVDSHYIAVSDNMPIIEIYNQQKEKIAVHDYSYIQTVHQRLTFLDTQNLSSNRYGRICSDCYIADNKLYLLLMYNENGNFMENRIAVFNLFPQLKFETLLELPGSDYSTFCVADDHKIYAYNNIENSLEVFQE